jgi:hypothetical protein
MAAVASAAGNRPGAEGAGGISGGGSAAAPAAGDREEGTLEVLRAVLPGQAPQSRLA